MSRVNQAYLAFHILINFMTAPTEHRGWQY